jgi:hypothetical protein
METVALKTKWKAFRLSIDKANFPVELQLEFIDLFESFKGIQRKERLKSLKEVFTDENGKGCVQSKVIEDLMHYNSIGRYELGLEKWFNKDVLVMYRVTSYSRDRNSIVDIIKTDIMEERVLFMDGFVKKLIIPLAILALSLIAISVNYFYLAPLFAGLFRIEDIFSHLPSGVYYTGRVLEVAGIWIFIFFLCLRVGFVKLRDSWVGRERDRWSNKFPFIIYRSFQSARILKMMSLMRESDLKPIDVLLKLQDWVNPYLKWHVTRWIKGFQQGKNKNTFFGVGLLSSKQLIRLRAQQEGGGDDFSKSLMEIAVHANKDAASTLYKYSRRLKFSFYILAAIFGLMALQGFSDLFMLMDAQTQ